jgi:3',5'-cyclic AMP phosphodiesterase CpdA
MALRLLQFSDIHFGDENAAALEAATDFAKRTRFDLLALCGDITQFGHPAEFDAASAWLRTLSRPWISTPGNHDTPWLGLIDRALRPFKAYDRAVGPVASTFAGPGLRAVALNTARGWQLRLNWSKGAISRRQAREAADQMRSAPTGSVRLVVCHHPLIEPAGEPMSARVRGRSAAAQRLVAAGADLILSGHLHAPFVQALPTGDGRTYGVGATTLSRRERGSPPGFNVIDLENDRLTVTAMGWDGRRLLEHRQWAFRLRGRGATADGTEAAARP